MLKSVWLTPVRLTSIAVITASLSTFALFYQPGALVCTFLIVLLLISIEVGAIIDLCAVPSLLAVHAPFILGVIMMVTDIAVTAQFSSTTETMIVTSTTLRKCALCACFMSCANILIFGAASLRRFLRS
jgi:hypothetical protein